MSQSAKGLDSVFDGVGIIILFAAGVEHFLFSTVSRKFLVTTHPLWDGYKISLLAVKVTWDCS
jgi:hypothetical protein